MSSIKDRLNEPTGARPGIGGELRQLQKNGQATAEEIREFLKSVEGKSPQEVMGAIAESSLFKSILIATIGCAVLLIVFSVIPYQIKQSAADEKPKAKAAEKAEAKEQEPAEPKQTAAAKPAENPDQAAPDAGVVDKLGIGETKTSDPKKNPLDGNIDNLLDGID